PSVDHLGREDEQGRRNVEAKHPGGLEIDHELEFGGLQDGQLSRLFALQNAAGIDAGLPIAIRNARSIAGQAAREGGCARFICRRHFQLRGERHQQVAPGVQERAGADQKSGRACAKRLNASSISRSLIASSRWIDSPRTRAADSTSAWNLSEGWKSRLMRVATVFAC